MFKLQQSETYYWPVEVEIPVDGRFMKGSFDAEFPRLPLDEQQELMSQVFDERAQDAEFFERIFLGFRGVKDEDGNDMANTEENRRKICNNQYAARGISRAYFDSLRGDKARRKN